MREVGIATRSCNCIDVNRTIIYTEYKFRLDLSDFIYRNSA